MPHGCRLLYVDQNLFSDRTELTIVTFAPLVYSILQPSQATRFPFLFFFGTSVIVRPVRHPLLAFAQLSHVLLAEFSVLSVCVSDPSNPSSILSKPQPGEQSRFDVPGGKLCFSLSAFSESFSTNVYRNLEHRTLNLIWWGFRFMWPAIAPRYQRLRP